MNTNNSEHERAQPFAVTPGLRGSVWRLDNRDLDQTGFLKDTTMQNIKVLGSGCSKCTITIRQIERVAHERGVEVTIDKVQDRQAIIGYGVLATPAVVIDGKVVHAGGVPSRDTIRTWFA